MSDELFRFIRGRYPKASVAAVALEGDTVVISTARPGILIGKEGAAFEQLCGEVAKFRGLQAEVKLQEIRRPELEPVLVADDLAKKLSQGRPPEQLLEVIAENCVRVGAKGCSIEVSGCVAARCERGELAGCVEAATEAVMEPPLEVDDDGNEIPPPPQPDPPQKFTVSVRISR
jgi:ribosomal protein S3